MRPTLLLFLFLIFLLPASLQAIPSTLSHQGMILDSSQTPVGGIVEVTFRLYTQQDGGTALWSETLNVSFDNGHYSVILGESSTLAPSLFNQNNLYLGVTMAGSDEFDDRHKISSVPFAFRAGTADECNGDIDAVGGLSIDGDPVIDENHEWVGPDISRIDESTLATYLSSNSYAQVNGEGSPNSLAKFSDTLVIENSVIYEIDGKIGIGIENPSSALEVDGEIRSTGGIQLGTSEVCDQDHSGTLRWTGSRLEVCNGTDWQSTGGNTGGGLSPSDPGTACAAILADNPGVSDDIYWIDPDGDGGAEPFQAYCDMTSNDGGWTLFYANNNKTPWSNRSLNFFDDFNINTSVMPHPDSGDASGFDPISSGFEFSELAVKYLDVPSASTSCLTGIFYTTETTTTTGD